LLERRRTLREAERQMAVANAQIGSPRPLTIVFPLFAKSAGRRAISLNSANGQQFLVLGPRANVAQEIFTGGGVALSAICACRL